MTDIQAPPMRRHRPSLGAVFWFLAFAAVVALHFLPRQQNPGDRQLTFDTKAFFDNAAMAPGSPYESVSVSGTLTGDALAYPNNTRLIRCVKADRRCEHFSIEQIGDRQLGRLSEEASYDVVAWNDSEIVASEDWALDCLRSTLTINRRSQVVLLVQEPINQTKVECKDVDRGVHKWTIEDSPAWKRMKSENRNVAE